MTVTVSEEMEAKRDRLVLSGALTVVYLTSKRLRVTCRGDHGTHWLTRDDDGPLRCSCPAAAVYGRLCSHLMACALICDGPWKDSGG